MAVGRPRGKVTSFLWVCAYVAQTSGIGGIGVNRGIGEDGDGMFTVHSKDEDIRPSGRGPRGSSGAVCVRCTTLETSGRR